MISKGTLLTLLAIVTVCQAISKFYAPEKEYIYNYHAKVNVGTFKPAIFASQFMLDGKLHMQNHENSIIMKFTDLKYKLYNGQLNQRDEYEAIPLPLPKEAEDLLKPFQISYEKNGKIKHFTADVHDHKFSTDMKKAVASLMQMDLEQIKFDAKMHYAFTTHEDSIYGNVLARYNVMPDETEMIIKKMLDVQSSEHWLAYFGITEDDRYEDIADRTPISIDSHREYTLMKEDNEFHIKSIDSQGGIFTHMMKGFTETQFMYVNQTIRFVEKVPANEKMSMSEETSTADDLSFKMGTDESEETITNLAFGRSNYKMDVSEKLVDEILDEVVAHIKKDKLNMEAPDLKQGQGINRLHRILAMLDLPALEKMFLQLEEQPDHHEKLLVFQEMIPLIGTRSSIKFVRNLIRKQKINDNIAISMLQEMPFHLRMPSAKLLTEVEDLMHLENVTPNVHKAAVLSFATLIHKVYSHYMIKNDLIKQTISEDLLEKYILKYMELLKTSKDYSMQFLYIHGLYNIRIGNVVKYLEPYVKGEATSNRNLRYLAMCASYIEVIKDPKYVFEIYWPIFVDTTLHLELRAGAYLTLMSTKPSREKLYDIYWVLKRDPCPELYNFHYTFLESMVHTQETVLQGNRPAEILNFMREPYRQSFTGNYMAEYMDPKYGFAALNNAMLFVTNTSKSMYIDFGTNMYNYQVMNYGLWLKIEGMDMTELFASGHISSMEQLMNVLTKCKDQNNLHIEYALLHNDKIIQFNVMECKNFEKFLMEFKDYAPKPSLSISYKLITQQIMPNDLGMPSVFQILIPTVMNVNLISIKDEQKHWMFRRSCDTTIGTSFYNPIADIWQGAERIQSNEIITDMTFKFAFIQPDTMKFTMYNQTDDTRDKFAMRNYATSITYVYKDVDNFLQQSSKSSSHFTKITTGDQYRKNKTLFEFDCHHTGLHFEIDVFDTKRHVSMKTIMEHLRPIFQRYFKNYETMPFGYMLLVLQNSAHELILSPEPGTFGLLIKATPSKIYPVNQVELLMRMKTDLMTDENSLKMLKKLNIKSSLTTRDEDNKMLKQWNANAKFIMNMDYEWENYNIHMTKMTMEKQMYEICMQGTQEMMNNKIIKYHHNITVGNDTSNDQVCSNSHGSMYITMNAGKSDEQVEMMENQMEYDECLPKHMHEPLLEGLKIDYSNDIDCMQMKTSLRKQEYDIKVNDEFLEHHCFKFLKGMLFPYYSNEKINNLMDENTMKIIMDYPTIGDEINVEIMENNMKHKIREMPTYFLRIIGFHPKNYYYSPMFMKMHRMKMIESCLIADRHIFNNDNELIAIMGLEWMRVVHSEPSNTIKHTIVVFVKQMETHIALKIKMEETILEIIPNVDNYKISLNDKPVTLTPDSYIEEKLFTIGMLNDKEKTIIMHMFNYPLYINYDGENIQMYKMMTDDILTGTCFMQ